MVHAKSTCLVPIVTHNFVHQTNYNLLQMCKYFPERNLEGSLHRYRSTLLLAVLLFRLFEGHTGVVRAESSLVGIITRSRGFSIATKSFSLICKVTCLVFGALTCFSHLKSLSKWYIYVHMDPDSTLCFCNWKSIIDLLKPRPLHFDRCTVFVFLGFILLFYWSCHIFWDS